MVRGRSFPSDYRSRRIEFERARRVARKTHDQPCDCQYCITAERLGALMAERIRLERLLAGEPPF